MKDMLGMIRFRNTGNSSPMSVSSASEILHSPTNSWSTIANRLSRGGSTSPTGTPLTNYSKGLWDVEFESTCKVEFDFSDFEDCFLYAEGTNAVIYRGFLGEDMVIIKMIKKEAENDPHAIKELRTELSIMRNTNHKHILKYIGSGTRPRLFIVLEYLNEGTLGDLYQRKELVRRHSLSVLTVDESKEEAGTNVDHSLRSTNSLTRRMSFIANEKPFWSYKDVLQRASELADALQYLHEDCIPDGTIIHRDLKPDNIGLLDGTVKLFDFGLSICIKSTAGTDESYEMSGCTGTMRYMAPEVALRRAYSEKADVYSFGIILWQMASGKVPFARMNKQDFTERVIKGGTRPELLPTWPDDFRDLLEACWSSNPQTRPSFGVILRRLDGAFLSAKSVLL